MKRAIVIFILTFLGILFAHNLTGLAGIHLDYSISKYVGLSSVSSIIFLISNALVAYFIWHELNPKITNKFQRVLLLIIIFTLIGLSICPFGFYDYIIPEPVILDRTPITFLHVIFSRIMFISMAIFSGYTFYLGDFKKRYKSFLTKLSLGFTIYAVLCVVCYLFFPSFFWSVDLIFESVYILGFFAVLLAFE